MAWQKRLFQIQRSIFGDFMLIRFDDIDSWAPKLTEVLRPLVPEVAKERIRQISPQYIEDAVALLFERSSKDSIIDATFGWIESNDVAAYHGTRLTDVEVDAVRAEGLVRLNAVHRRPRLVRVLSGHPQWPATESQLNSAIDRYGRRGLGGVRENQVHLTLSRAGLTNSFSHYLKYGSEFDQCVARELLGDEGLAMLARDGAARVIELAVPGPKALATTHPFFSVAEMRSKGELPNLVRQFVQTWAFRHARPGYQTRTMELDCGLFFRTNVPSDWIVEIDTLSH